MGNLSLEEFVEHIDDVYSLPPVVAHVNRVVNDPESSAQDVASAISTDVAMASRVLRLVNSAFFGFSRRIASLKTAVVVLGYQEIRNLVLTLGVIRGVCRRGADFPFVPFWRHSVAVGVFAEAVLERKEWRMKDEAFIAGLLHDLGKLLVGQELGEEVRRIGQLCEKGNQSFSAEREVLGFDHAELGAAVADRWRFPERLVTLVKYHHKTEASPENRRLAAAIEFSDLCVRASLIDLPGNKRLPPLKNEVWDSLQIEGEDLGVYFDSLKRVGEVLKTIFEASQPVAT